MHHEQDMRKMGGLREVHADHLLRPCWIGTLALVGTPFFSGFYSKDSIIEAARARRTIRTAGSRTYAYWAVLLGVFVTAFYSFRLLYMTFHGKERFRDRARRSRGARSTTPAARPGARRTSMPRRTP
mgnify:CR=1 FL=1